MTAQGDSRWRFAVLPIVVVGLLAPRFFSYAMLMPWILLVIAAALIVTILVVGIQAWRRGQIDSA